MREVVRLVLLMTGWGGGGGGKDHTTNQPLLVGVSVIEQEAESGEKQDIISR